MEPEPRLSKSTARFPALPFGVSWHVVLRRLWVTPELAEHPLGTLTALPQPGHRAGPRRKPGTSGLCDPADRRVGTGSF